MRVELEDYDVEVPVTPIIKEQVFQKVMQYYIKNQCFAGEVLMQDDDCIIDAPNVLAEILDDILQPKVTSK